LIADQSGIRDPKSRIQNPESEIMHVLIIGVGSPFGDDRLGWVAAQMLRRSAVLNALEPGQVTIELLDRPGVMLLERWRDAGSVIVLDAVRSGAPPGTQHRLDPGGLPVLAQPASSHGFGVAAALELARVLGNLPPRLFLLGIELDPSRSDTSLSPAVSRALPVFVEEIEELVLALVKPVIPRSPRMARI
jgi:hydrogenase maturation protease